jgi:hypothetical protein
MRTLAGCARFVAFAAVIVVSGWSCSSSDTANGNGGTEAVSAPIGPAGGEVKTSDGSGVHVPPGALGASADISVSSAPTAPTPAGYLVLGAPILCGPEGQTFSQAVTVTLAYDPSKLPAGVTASRIVVQTAPAGSSAFTVLPTTVVDATHVSAQTTHFSVFEATIAPNDVAPSSDAGVIASNDAGSSTDDAGTSTNDAGIVDSGTSEDAGSGPATVLCGSACSDLSTDSANCGSCGHACPSGQACTGGVCMTTCGGRISVGGCSGPGLPTCSGSQTACACGDNGGTCVDLQTDRNNCGACGTICAADQNCIAGTCTAQCTGGTSCLAGFCRTACPSGTTSCGGKCADVSTDSANCGSCGHACPSGQGCTGGVCMTTCGNNFSTGGCSGPGLPTCGGSQTACACGDNGGTCVDLQTDRNHCGACGTVCAADQNCIAGTCTAQCTGGTSCLAGFCRTACP